MSAITSAVQAARRAAVETVQHATPSLAKKAEKAAVKAFGTDARVVARKAARTPKAEGTSLVRRLMVAAGWIKPNAEESKLLINKLLREQPMGLGPVNQPYSPNFKLRLKELADGRYAFSSRVERWDPTVPYASQERPLTLLGVFDPVRRKIDASKTINRTPAPWETGERIFMESRPFSLWDFFFPPPMKL